jgi:hypothetical protein
LADHWNLGGGIGTNKKGHCLDVLQFFHLFLDAYAILIFLFFFFFKPLYIIMVLNWAFDSEFIEKIIL